MTPADPTLVERQRLDELSHVASRARLVDLLRRRRLRRREHLVGRDLWKSGGHGLAGLRQLPVLDMGHFAILSVVREDGNEPDHGGDVEALQIAERHVVPTSVWVQDVVVDERAPGPGGSTEFAAERKPIAQCDKDPVVVFLAHAIPRARHSRALSSSTAMATGRSVGLGR